MAGKMSLKGTFNQILNFRSSDTKELYIIINIYREHFLKYTIELAKK